MRFNEYGTVQRGRVRRVKQGIAGLRFLSSRQFVGTFIAILLLLSAMCMGWGFCLAWRDMAEIYVAVPASAGVLFASFAAVLEISTRR
jgi:hypothetical protein